MSEEQNINEPQQPAFLQGAVIKSFRKKIFIEVFCAKCGERFNNNDDYESVFQDKDEAIESLEMDGWEVKGKSAFCENCLKDSGREE